MSLIYGNDWLADTCLMDVNARLFVLLVMAGDIGDKCLPVKSFAGLTPVIRLN
jgi:hypothetical protein